MNNDLKQRLEKLTSAERERRFRELREKLGLANPKQLDGETPAKSLEELGEYQELKKMLGYD